jgi:hypothetical protein
MTTASPGCAGLLGVLLLGSWVLAVPAQKTEKLAPVPPPEQATFQVLTTEAQRGSARAQFELGEAYDSGKLVARNPVAAFKWWLKAAEQGHRTAQHNVGVAYLTGVGTERNKDEAIKWFVKAAEQGDTEAAQYAQRLKDGQSAAPKVMGKGPPPVPRPTVREAPARATPVNAAIAANTEREHILAQIVAEYHRTHTYVGNDIYQCVDMASDVWNQVLTKGIEAHVMVGNIEKDIVTLLDANHAWVLAEVSPGKMVALETTGGMLV